MQTLAGPIEKIGKLGQNVGEAFNSMASGLSEFINVLQEDAGWFTSFEEQAHDIAKALETMSGPIRSMTETNTAQLDQATRNAAREAASVQAEEIKNALAVSIDTQSETDSEIIDELRAIRSIIEEIGGTSEMADDVKKATSIPWVIHLERTRLLILVIQVNKYIIWLY